MNIYRVADSDNYECGEGARFIESLIPEPLDARDCYYAYGKTTFTKEQMGHGKYFFIDFLDAVKFSIFYKKRNYPVIASFQVPDDLAEGKCGIGYYKRNDNIRGNVALYDYFAFELFIQFNELCDNLNGTMNERGFRTTNPIRYYKLDSNEVQKAIELTRKRGTIPDYQDTLLEALKIFDCEYQNWYRYDRPFEGDGDYRLTEDKKEQLFRLFINAKAKTVTETNIDEKLKQLK